jgi:hypothetical protein
LFTAGDLVDKTVDVAVDEGNGDTDAVGLNPGVWEVTGDSLGVKLRLSSAS